MSEGLAGSAGLAGSRGGRTRRARGTGRPDRVIRRPDDIGVPAVELVIGLSRSGRSGRSGVPLGSWPATAGSGVARTTRMPPGSAAAWVLVLALARRRLVGRVARWQRAARANRSAGSHCLPRHAVAGRAASRDACGFWDEAAPRGDMGSRAGHALARRHRVAGPRRLPGSHVVTRWHGRQRLAAGGIRCPAGTARVHPWLRVTRARRLGARPAGRRPVLAPPAGRRSRGSRGSWVGGVRRSAGFPGCSGLLASRARDHPWARRAGRPANTRLSGSARNVGRNALPRRARRDRFLRPGHQRGAGPGGAPAMCRAQVTCRARRRRRLRASGPPAVIRRATGGRGLPPVPIRAMAKTTRTTSPNRRPSRPRPAPAWSYWQARVWPQAA